MPARPTPAPSFPRASVATRRRLREQIRTRCEDRPGVYRVLDATSAVAYVGKSRRLRARLLGYFTPKGRRGKPGRILRQAHGIEWEYCSSEFAALLRELALIKRHRPRLNHAMRADERPRGYVALLGGAVPGLTVLRRTDDPVAEQLYGPFRRVRRLTAAVRALAEATGVRDCLPKPPGVLRYAGGRRGPRTPGCLRHALGTCAGPCVGTPTAGDYARRVAEAADFLAGRTRAPLVRLRAAMQAASAACQYERAGALKAKLEVLGWLARRLGKFRANMDRLTLRYTVTGSDGASRVYLIRRGTVRAEMPAPTTDDEARALAALEQRVLDGPDPRGLDTPVHDLEEFYLIASWFRRHPVPAGR